MKTSYRTLSFVFAAAAATLGFSGLANAQGDADPVMKGDYKQVEVSYKDLDLGHVADAQKLYARISSAARDACRQNGSVLFRSSVYRDCVGRAVDGAVHTVSNENLTAVHLRSAGSRAVAAAGR
jgi:UrcA family protein